MSQFDPPPTHVHHPDEAGNHPNAAAAPQTNSKEQLLRVVAVVLRAFSLLFSFLCFVIILTVEDFNKSDTFNYVLAAALLSIIYNVFQTVKGVLQLAARKELISNAKVLAFIDFIGDQVITYLVLSASSAGLSRSNEYLKATKGIKFYAKTRKEYSKAAGASSMLFFAFVVLVFPTILSFRKLIHAFK